MTKKQLRFCQEYLTDRNEEEAAERAGYKSRGTGKRLLAQREVFQYVKARDVAPGKPVVTRDMVLAELIAIGFADIADYVTVGENEEYTSGKDRYSLDLPSTMAIDRSKRGVISGIRQSTTGVELKFYDKLKALEILGRYLGMFEKRDDESGQLEDLIKELREDE